MVRRVWRAHVPTALLIALLASTAVFTAPAAAAARYSVQNVVPWMQNAAPVGWSVSLNRVIFNSMGADGMFNAYSANPDASDQRCLTCASPSFPKVGTATNRGASDVSPDGRYMLVTVERADHPGQIGAMWTQPGKGGSNDLWLYTTDGTEAWPLTNINAPGQQSLGTIWPRFDRTGTEVVWASMYAPALANLGYWQLKVANIVWNGGVPSLANIRTIMPAAASFYEPYGFTADDSHIIFASNAGMPSWIDNEIDEIATDGTGLRALTTPVPGALISYNEFAFDMPGDNAIIYGSTHDATSGGMDYWTMNPDGSDPQRLTYFNAPWHTESLGYSVVGGLAFNPRNPQQFIAGVAADPNAQTINAQTVTLAAPAAAPGLTEQFFATPNFGQPVATTTQNPSDGFYADGAPAAGVPASNYSIRWTGTITPSATGSYTFCLVADTSAQLLLGGQQLVNGRFSFGQRDCATTAETAGTAVSIELDFQHRVGPGYAQLSWIPPGGSTPTTIPSSALSSPAPVRRAAACRPRSRRRRRPAAGARRPPRRRAPRTPRPARAAAGGGSRGASPAAHAAGATKKAVTHATAPRRGRHSAVVRSHRATSHRRAARSRRVAVARRRAGLRSRAARRSRGRR